MVNTIGSYIDGAIADAGEFIRGVPADALGTTSRKSFADIFIRQGRLRGLGVLLLVVGVVLFLYR